jgi:hypothetical protein
MSYIHFIPLDLTPQQVYLSLIDTLFALKADFLSFLHLLEFFDPME